MKKSNILISGASGFIGQALISYLTSHNLKPIAAVRTPNNTLPSNIQQIQVGDLLPNTNWKNALSDIDVVIHLAARVHIMNDVNENPLAEFRKVNTLGTLNLARQASKAGVRRLIFLSSIKVNGESTSVGKKFSAQDNHIPVDPYGLSKYEAEQGLKEIAIQTGIEVVIIRPPLVYGPNVKANFLSMINWLHKGIPLPLGAINNRRSLVSLDNLINLIALCIDHPAAKNQTFLVSDDNDLSTTELLKRTAKALGKPTRLIPLPVRFLSSAAILLGKRDIADRLCGFLQVDITHTKKTLGWFPPVSVNDALQKTADAYLNKLEKEENK